MQDAVGVVQCIVTAYGLGPVLVPMGRGEDVRQSLIKRGAMQDFGE